MVEDRGGLVDTDTSCPRCGAGTAAGASTCDACGYVFFESPAGRRLPRPSPLWTGLTLALLAGAVAIAVLASRDSPQEPPAAVPSASAERQLVSRLRADGVDDAGSVRCRGSIRPGRLTRCHLLYLGGDTQLLLVNLTADGALDIEEPYPAQRRPGD
jgi:ribosomal protein S27AE